jgi:hypothetical protein
MFSAKKCQKSNKSGKKSKWTCIEQEEIIKQGMDDQGGALDYEAQIDINDSVAPEQVNLAIYSFA